MNQKKHLFRSVFAMALVLCMVLGMVPAVSAAQPTTLTVVSYNIAGNKAIPSELIAQDIAARNADLVGLQEVDKLTGRNPHDVPAELVAALGQDYTAVYGKTIDLTGGEYGNAVLSRLPIKSSDHHMFPDNGYERRCWIRIEVEIEGKTVAMYNTHLSYETLSARNLQMEELLAAVDADPTPYKIITGDFNADQFNSEFYRFLYNYNIVNGHNNEWIDSFVGEDPAMRTNAVDNIITTRNMKLVTKGSDYRTEGAHSDHRMLYASFQLLDTFETSTQLLDLRIAEAQEVLASGLEYDPADAAALQTALDAAVNGEKATQDQINALARPLEAALGNMVPVAGPVAWYTFDDETITDQVANSNGVPHGAVSYVPSHSAEAGLALSTDGGYVTIEKVNDAFRWGTGDASMSFWFRCNDYSSNYWIIGDKNWDTGANPGFGVCTYNNRIYSSFADNGKHRTEQQNLNTLDLIRDGMWHHIAATVDRDGQSLLYIDGKQVADANVNPSSRGNSLTDLPFCIGADVNGNYGPHAQFDDLKIYKQVLTPEQVQKDYGVEPREPLSENCKIIPVPVSYKDLAGTFTLGENARFVITAEDADKKIENAVEVVAAELRKSTGYALPVVHGEPANGDIVLSLDAALADEGYTMTVSPEQVVINAKNSAGVYYGLQSLRQMFPGQIESDTLVENVDWTAPCAEIQDYPRFGYRSAQLDVSRHFFGVEEVKRQLDHMSQYKLNKLHLHLADDQGWRIEIKNNGQTDKEGNPVDYSKLTELGGSTSCSHNGYRPGFFTQEEFKDIVAYAAARNVEIIPEIDMPAHSWAALVSMPMLNSTADGKPVAGGYDNTKPYNGWDVGWASMECRNENTYIFVEEVIKQISAISPSKYFHIGGDEAHVTSHEDYVYFVNRVTDIAQKYGKTPIGWQKFDENTDDPENTITQFWGGNARCRSGLKYVLSPNNRIYMDMKYDADCALGLQWAGFISVERAYSWDPSNYGTEDQIVGIEAPIWTETLSNPEHLDYMYYPRILGVAEISWSPRETHVGWNEYKVRLAQHRDRLENLEIAFRDDTSVWEKHVNFHMPFDDAPDAKGQVFDTTGKYTGTFGGNVQQVPGKVGSAVYLDGQSYVDLKQPDIHGDWTAAMWVKREASGGTNAALLSGSASELKLEQWKNTGKVGITEFGVQDYTYDYAAPIGQWVHLTFVGDSAGTTLYVNGVKQQKLSAVIPGPAGRVGQNAKADLEDNGAMKGSIDELHVYERALTAEEVKALATVQPAKIQVSSVNMTLGNELSMNFMVKKSDVTDLTGLSLQITKTFADGREPVVVTVPAGSWKDYNKDYYAVKFTDISAKEMTDEITAVVLKNGKPAGDVYTDSVAAYALRILRKNETRAELKSVIVDMLNYGTEAQMQFQYHEEKLANAELTELDQYWASEAPYARDARVKGDRYFGSNLNLGSNMALTLYFKGITPDMHAEIAYVKHTGDPKTVTVSGADFVKFNNTVYGIRADMLVVADAKQLVTVKVYDAENNLVASASDSVAGYLTRVENVDALGDAILKFSASAKRYFKNSTAASATLKPQDFGIDLDQLIADGVLQHKSFTDPETGITMWYWISVPADYETRSYPVVTMFHGYGEGGDGIPDKSGSDGPDKIRNNLSMNSGIIYALLAEHNRRDYPCIILAPQTPCLQDGTARSKWVDMGPSWNHSSRDMDANPRTPNLTTALHILQNVVQTCNADADRLYLTGLSMGGMATWDLGTGNPELFAALAPICGIGDPAKAEQLQDMPIHAFHGMKDPVVPVEACKTMWNALRGYGNMSSTLFPYEFHGSWNYVYGPEYVQGLIQWMFNQSKSGPLDGCADKRPLRQLLMQAQQADPKLYTSDGWDRLQSVFRDANAVLNRSQATAAELHNASRALTDALEAQKKQSNLALTATVASSVPATYKTTLAGLNDGIIQDNKANFTVFANTALPTISYTWAEPQSVEGVEVVTFVAQKFGVQKYELLYTTTENPEPVSLGVHSITWTTNSNQDYESNQWILDTPLDHVTSLQFHILQGGRDTYCTFQELKVLG